MDRQTAIERITETENLTDGLEDDDANWLLDWGIARVDGLLAGISDGDAAGEKLNQLMAVMRSLNQIAADRAAATPDALAADIRMFLARYQQAFGAPKADAPAPTASPTPTQATTVASETKSAPASTVAKDGRAPGAATLPATALAIQPAPPRADVQQTKQSPASSKPASSAPTPLNTPTPAPIPTKKGEAAQPQPSTPAANAPSSAAPSANAPTASDQSAQAASKIAAMTPRDAMRYLLALADPSSVAP
jgi:hypothetical protein